ncbi:hypothetical protein SVIOM342S_01745 [Streptomyces violaceorubidus]
MTEETLAAGGTGSAGLPSRPEPQNADPLAPPATRAPAQARRTARWAWADRHSVSLDATLLAAYCTALAALQDKPFALPVVCFTGSDAQRPAEFTELTWVRSPEPGTDPATLARAYCRQLAQDLERGGGAGLAEMRSLVVGRARGVHRGPGDRSAGCATEATVWSNWYPVADVDPEWRSIPYGRPIDNARYYVLDGHMEPCRRRGG